ncbi:hypothetical protein [Nonomuraea basaltis]|nr:hypothetical protein [Nonomuraea basaltis]
MRAKSNVSAYGLKNACVGRPPTPEPETVLEPLRERSGQVRPAL